MYEVQKKNGTLSLISLQMMYFVANSLPMLLALSSLAALPSHSVTVWPGPLPVNLVPTLLSHSVRAKPGPVPANLAPTLLYHSVRARPRIMPALKYHTNHTHRYVSYGNKLKSICVKLTPKSCVYRKLYCSTFLYTHIKTTFCSSLVCTCI